MVGEQPQLVIWLWYRRRCPLAGAVVHPAAPPAATTVPGPWGEAVDKYRNAEAQGHVTPGRRLRRRRHLLQKNAKGLLLADKRVGCASRGVRLRTLRRQVKSGGVAMSPRSE